MLEFLLIQLADEAKVGIVAQGRPVLCTPN